MGHTSLDTDVPRQACRTSTPKKAVPLQRRGPAPDFGIPHVSLKADQLHRLQGLSRHLSRPDRVVQHTQVTETDIEALIPQECSELLRSEFEHRCSFGDRTNLEFMSSAKWVKFLKDIGFVVATRNAGERKTSHSGAVLMKPAQADLVFSRALQGTESRDSKRLTYSLFCKALYLAATSVWPDTPPEDAFAAIIGISTSTQTTVAIQSSHAAIGTDEPARKVDDAPAVALDSDALRVLAHFKPALDDLFVTLCSQASQSSDTGNSGAASAKGVEGAILAKSCTWASLAPSAMRAAAPNASNISSSGIPISYGGEPAQELRKQAEIDAEAARALAAISAGVSTGCDLMSPSELTREERREKNARGSVDVMPEIIESENETDEDDEKELETQLEDPFAPIDCLSATVRSSGSATTSIREATNRAGVPRQVMFQERFLHMCRELKLVPQLLTRPEAMLIFKRSICSGAGSSGSLSAAAFVDALADCAITAYSKPPFSKVYVEAHEKIHAFFLAVLPGTSREMHERFLYSRSRR